MDPYWGPHFFGWMWIFPVTFLVMGLVLLFVFMFRGPGWFIRHWNRHSGRETARDILDRRYANGEITLAQYEEMRRTLGSR
ncbi:MAG: SHOCT domain-containing protein [Burkholderiales bacterium]